MGIWIRSQDRKYLTNVNFAWINYSNTIFGDFNSLEGSGGTLLGKYQSEAETLQVLDEIEEVMIVIAKHPDANPVYQMPEAGFSEKFAPVCGSAERKQGGEAQ